MVMVPLRDIGVGGLVPDQQPYDVELTQFPAGNNVQISSGRLGKALGYVEVEDLAIALPALSLDFTSGAYTADSDGASRSVQPTHVAGWAAEGTDKLIIGTEDKLLQLTSGGLTDVTSAAYPSGYSNSPRWQMQQIGTGFLANNGSDKPQYMSAAGTEFGDMANWPAALRSHSIRPFLSFLVLSGYVDGSAEYPYTVRWSDEFDPVSVPGSWDITSTTNLAGETILGARFGRLIDSLPLAGVNIVYAERGAYAMSYIGAPLVFAFRELFDDGGIINRGAVCVFDNRHFVVGRDDIYIHDGSSKKAVATNRVKETFYDSIADTRSIFVVNDNSRNEIWVGYADKNAANPETANRALVWNYSNDAWTFRDLPNVRSMCVGPAIGGGGSGTGATWADLDVQWDSWSLLWADLGADTQAKNTRLFSAGYADAKVYAHNETYGAAGAGFVAFVEAAKIDLDKVFQRSTQGVLQIKRVMPQMKGVGAVTLRIGSSQGPSDPVLWKSTRTFNIETDHKVDTRVSGRYLAIRVESADNLGYWQLGGFDLDVEEVSER